MLSDAQPTTNGEWIRWSQYVLRGIEANCGSIERLEEKVNAQSREIAMLQVKAGMVGALGGAIAALIPILYMLVSK